MGKAKIMTMEWLALESGACKDLEETVYTTSGAGNQPAQSDVGLGRRFSGTRVPDWWGGGLLQPRVVLPGWRLPVSFPGHYYAFCNARKLLPLDTDP